ncbi:transcriptional regulation of mitochondrial recombination-domain-containing protein [Hypoxylon sp. FL0543]|nr:transcriptional regulation of mitochondrial recombination-domain-containing protein [Hypoxylon sp. FL0543]
MALRVNSITAQLAKLPFGISRTCVRFKSMTKEEVEEKKKHHGLKIWIFHHFLDGMTVFTLNPVMKASKSLRQIAFNGKKLKPSKFRKDYWRPLAMIQFPEGYAQVGLSVYQRLYECKRLHQLSWGDEMFYDGAGNPLTKHERGKKLNDQKANTIADMAAVLGGTGKGNKIWMPVTDNPKELANLEAGNDKAVKEDEKGVKALVKAQVWWKNKEDSKFAKSWPPNVTHYAFDEAVVAELGMEPDPDGEPGTAPEELAAEEQPQKEAGQRTSP